jgi:ketosteroid isomerase-like protein
LACSPYRCIYTYHRDVVQSGATLTTAWLPPSRRIGKRYVVTVRDDIAVTWGLNRMQAHEPGNPTSELWSRETRVFQRIDGKWKLIHQHVSFPYDPESGQAVTDLRP